MKLYTIKFIGFTSWACLSFLGELHEDVLHIWSIKKTPYARE
jgi:hypothetical protein